MKRCKEEQEQQLQQQPLQQQQQPQQLLQHHQQQHQQPHQQPEIKVETISGNPQDDSDNEYVPEDFGCNSQSNYERAKQDAEEHFPPDLSAAQSKYKEYRGLTAPIFDSKKHPAFPLLHKYATQGCPAECGEAWTKEHIEAAIKRGNHQSAENPQAAECCRNEAKDKEAAGFVKLVRWKDIENNIPTNLKISPVAAIDHNSRDYRMILDLSFNLRVGRTKYASVNESTIKMAPQQSMHRLGTAIPRIIQATAEAPTNKGPICFAKFNIKDGFWRMAVDEEQAWNFAYVLPKEHPTDETILVAPSSLQMGWTESPPFFCAASETARDLAEDLLKNDPTETAPHRLERRTLPDHWADVDDVTYCNDFSQLIESYVDDFCVLVQSSDPSVLLGKSRQILTAINQVFPPPEVTHDKGEDPISNKKIDNGDGVWNTKKELLGWLFDGVARCIMLPADKVQKITKELSSAARHKKVPFKRMEQLQGKLQWTTYGIPGGKPLLTPIIRALKAEKQCITITDNLAATLRQWRALIRESGKLPTHAKELMVGIPAFIGYCDASKEGAGGVWFSGTDYLRPIVWRVEWPKEVAHRWKSFDNPKGDITNSDAEMAALLLQWLVLEMVVGDLKYKHVAAWSDNTPTVGWAKKSKSTKSVIGQRLISALTIRQRKVHASPLATSHIAGIANHMADAASRSFGSTSTSTYHLTDRDFLLYFVKTFKLPQKQYWRICLLNSKLVQKVTSELLNDHSTPESWRQITKKGSSIGKLGQNSPHRLELTPCSKMRRRSNKSSSSKLLLKGSGEAYTAEEKELELQRYNSHYEQLARPSNWLVKRTPSTAPQTSTYSSSNDR